MCVCVCVVTFYQSSVLLDFLVFVLVIDFKTQRFPLKQAATSKRIFTPLGPLFVRSQSDDFSAVAGALVVNITTNCTEDTFGGKKTQT